jgi:hypothetical protein
MLYSHGEGPLPWVLPRSRSNGGEIEPSSKLIQAFLPEPSVVKTLMKVLPSPKNL